MSSALSKLIVLFLLLSGAVRAQEEQCFGETFVHLLSDDRGRDLRITCALTYPGPSGDLLLGGGVDGNIILSRIDRRGNLRWRRVIRATSESTELSTLNELVVDRAGNIAGVGTTFNDNEERAYLFRYDPRADTLLYFLQPAFSSEFTGIELLNDDDEYLITGSRLGGVFPVFISAYSQRIRQADGQPEGPGTIYDFRGDESFLDAVLAADGTRYVVGNLSATGGAGDIRSLVARIDPAGVPEWTVLGPVGGDINARLYAFDVELINDKLYVLHWGNIGNITGGINTTVFLSCFNPTSGALRWSYDYDITDFNGENGLEMEPTNDGLLLYGMKLIGKRDPWLMKLRFDGEVAWVRSYEIPGNALIYVRANQQLQVDETGITALASYGYTDGAPRTGLALRLDPDGRTEDGCLNVRTLEVIKTPQADGWQAANLEANEVVTVWQDEAQGTEPADFTTTDDCGISCEDCSVRSLGQVFVCRSDSVFIAGAFRQRAGVYADTIPAVDGGCDSIRFTELIVSDGPSATYSVRRQCGLAEAEVRISATGLALPLRYSWSAAGATGSTAYLPAGTYQVTVNDAIGCRPFVLDVEVEAPPRTIASLAVSAPVCPGESSGSIRLVPPGSGAIKRLPNNDFVPDALTGLTAGSYQLVVKDSTGCEVFRQVNVPPATEVAVSITGSGRVRLGDELNLEAEHGPGQNFVSNLWVLPGESMVNSPVIILRPRASGTYYLTSTTDRGCTARDSIDVNIYRGAPRIYVPTAFSPNGDGVNDVFAPGLGPDVERVTEWEIFDRWGGLRWAYDGGEWWNGYKSASGTYTWRGTALLIDGTEVTLLGQVTLVR